MHKQVNLRVSVEFLAQLDEHRGLVPREAWMRRALSRVLAEEMGGSFQGSASPVVGRSPVGERKPDLSEQVESLAEGRPFPSPPAFDRIVVESGSMAEPSVQDVLRARIAELEDKPMFSEPVVELSPEQKELEDRAREAAGEDPVHRRRYEEDDPRAWAE